MWYIYKLVSIIIISMNIIPIFKFNSEVSLKNWQTVNDGVMGGISESTIILSEEGFGLFSGHVSLKNNGGFASVRLTTKVELENTSQEIVFRIKGDGKEYQFRIKSSKDQSESYVQTFKTTGEWQTLRLNISDFYPQYRGQKLGIPNFNFENIQLISFLIANNKEEDFNLLIDYIGID